MNPSIPRPVPTLGVAEAAREVMRRARHVAIDDAAIRAFCERFRSARVAIPQWNTELHYHEGGWRTANYVLVLDALNFCFWADPGQERWSATFRGATYNGYWGLAAALHSAIDAGMPLLDASYLEGITEADVRRVFAGQNEVPLLDARVRHLREVGRVLNARYDGRFSNMIEACQGDAVTLAARVADELPSFHDVTTYDELVVPVLKRAQIIVVDLYGTFGGQGWGHFDRLDQLTAFADYKVPQVLRREGMLTYTPALEATIDALELIPPNDPREVEIRCATVEAVERIRTCLAESGPAPRSFEVDWLLWDLGQTPAPTDRPYHRTRTVYY